MAHISETEYAQLVAASYGGDIPLPSGFPVVLSGAYNHVQYDVVRHDATATTAVVFPGSNQFADWLRHPLLIKTAIPGGLKPENEKGRARFHGAWLKDARAALLQVTPTLVKAYQDGDRITFLGHSYGGPLAIYCAYVVSFWRHVDIEPTRTYGSPAPANRDFARFFAVQIPNAIRYANPGDIVTRVPISGTHCGRLVKLPFTFPAHGMRRYLRAIRKLKTEE